MPNKTMKKTGLMFYRIAAWLPIWLLDAFGFVGCFFIYFVMGRGVKRVYANLRHAFPEKTERRRHLIARVSYLYEVECAMEAPKLSTISTKSLRKHLSFENLAEVRAQLMSRRPVVAFFSHCSRCEWVSLVGKLLADVPHVEPIFAFRPRGCASQAREQARLRFGVSTVDSSEAIAAIGSSMTAGRVPFVIFMPDEEPRDAAERHTVDFLNGKAEFSMIAEEAATAADAAAFFIDTSKICRGHYHLQFIPLPRRRDDRAGALTERYAAILQQNITRQPTIWHWNRQIWSNQ